MRRCSTCQRPCFSEFCSLGCASAYVTLECLDKEFFPESERDNVIHDCSQMLGGQLGAEADE